MAKKRCQGPKHCPDCPFQSRTVGARGPLDAKIVIVGESPGTNEVIEGVPFIGPSGKLLSILLKEAGFDEREIYITNSFQCLPPRSKDENGNKVKDGVLNNATRACRGRLFAELSAYPRDLIITMGSAAARSLSEAWNFSIMQKRGQVLTHVLATDGFPIAKHGVLPTYHPAYILRNPSATPQIRSDLQRAYRLLTGKGYPKPTYEYKLLTTEREITSYLYAQRMYGPYIVADIESTGLDRYKDQMRIIGFMFAHEVESFGHNVVRIVDGRRNGALVKHLFKTAWELSSSDPEVPIKWVWHNGKFDVSFLRAKGIPHNQCRVDEDTLLLSYSLDEVGGRHSLEQCVVDHLGLPEYKDKIKAHMKKTGTDWRTVDKDHLCRYNAEDVVHTALLFNHLHPKVMRVKHLRKAYKKLMIPASNALATIELNGMPIDQTVLAASQKELEGKMEAARVEVAKVVMDEDFNPNSHKQVTAALKKLGIKARATDKDSLKPFKGTPFVDKLMAFRGVQKLLGTYIKPFVKYGSRVHTSYLIHGTVTGRLSSSGPNMQNIPKEDIVRRHFKTPPGRVFVSFDYSQAELRSLAVLSGDKNLIDIFKSGKDMHAAVAAEVYGKLFTRESEYLPDGKTENPVYNKYRRYAKTVNFGVVYGATEPTLMERLGITWDEAHKLVTGWFAMFPEAREFMDECRAAPMLGRPLITVFGRQRRFYVVAPSNIRGQENEAGNFPHQSMCSDFTLDAAIELDRIYHSTQGLPGNAFQVNIIHDDNMFECDDSDEEILKLCKLVMPIMEGIPVKHGITLLPFKTDAKKGTVWSQMQKIKGLVL